MQSTMTHNESRETRDTCRPVAHILFIFRKIFWETKSSSYLGFTWFTLEMRRNAAARRLWLNGHFSGNSKPSQIDSNSMWSNHMASTRNWKLFAFYDPRHLRADSPTDCARKQVSWFWIVINSLIDTFVFCIFFFLEWNIIFQWLIAIITVFRLRFFLQ